MARGIQWRTGRPGGGFKIPIENPTYADGQAAAMYGQFPPLVNASTASQRMVVAQHCVYRTAVLPGERAHRAGRRDDASQRRAGSQPPFLLGTNSSPKNGPISAVNGSRPQPLHARLGLDGLGELLRVDATVPPRDWLVVHDVPATEVANGRADRAQSPHRGRLGMPGCRRTARGRRPRLPVRRGGEAENAAC
jgi:hypothetical protein